MLNRATDQPATQSTIVDWLSLLEVFLSPGSGNELAAVFLGSFCRTTTSSIWTGWINYLWGLIGSLDQHGRLRQQSGGNPADLRLCISGRMRTCSCSDPQYRTLPLSEPAEARGSHDTISVPSYAYHLSGELCHRVIGCSSREPLQYDGPCCTNPKVLDH